MFQVKEKKSNAHAKFAGRDSPDLSDALLPSASSTPSEPACPISMWSGTEWGEETPVARSTVNKWSSPSIGSEIITFNKYGKRCFCSIR